MINWMPATYKCIINNEHTPNCTVVFMLWFNAYHMSNWTLSFLLCFFFCFSKWNIVKTVYSSSNFVFMCKNILDLQKNQLTCADLLHSTSRKWLEIRFFCMSWHKLIGRFNDLSTFHSFLIVFWGKISLNYCQVQTLSEQFGSKFIIERFYLSFSSQFERDTHFCSYNFWISIKT